MYKCVLNHLITHRRCIIEPILVGHGLLNSNCWEVKDTHVFSLKGDTQEAFFAYTKVCPLSCPLGQFHHNTLLFYSSVKRVLEAVHAYSLGCARWMQQVRGMAWRASRRAVLAVGIAPSLSPAAAGARTGGSSSAVSFYVFTQVIAAHKSLVAHRTGEPFLPGVCA